MTTAIVAWILATLIAWAPSTTCDDLRSENVRLETENRALRAVAGRKWPGK